MMSQPFLSIAFLLAVAQVIDRLTAAWAYHSTWSSCAGRGNGSLAFLDFSVHFSWSSQPPSFLTGTTWLLQRAVTTAKTAGQLKGRKPTEWPRWVVNVRADLEIGLNYITTTPCSVTVVLVEVGVNSVRKCDATLVQKFNDWSRC